MNTEIEITITMHRRPRNDGNMNVRKAWKVENEINLLQQKYHLT